MMKCWMRGHFSPVIWLGEKLHGSPFNSFCWPTGTAISWASMLAEKVLYSTCVDCIWKCNFFFKTSDCPYIKLHLGLLSTIYAVSLLLFLDDCGLGFSDVWLHLLKFAFYGHFLTLLDNCSHDHSPCNVDLKVVSNSLVVRSWWEDSGGFQSIKPKG